MSDLKRSPPSSFSTAAPQLPRVAEATVAYEAQTPRHQSGNTTTNSTRSIPENHSSRSIPEEDTGKGYNRGTDVTSIKDDGLDTARPNANLTAQNLQERTPQNGERLYDSVSSYSNQPIRQNLTMGTVSFDKTAKNLYPNQSKSKSWVLAACANALSNISKAVRRAFCISSCVSSMRQDHSPRGCKKLRTHCASTHHAKIWSWHDEHTKARIAVWANAQNISQSPMKDIIV